MSNKLSYSAIKTYQECGQKYDFRYNKKLRSKFQKGALSFGSAIDTALNHLLTTRNVQESIDVFDKAWAFQWINKKMTALAEFPDLVYAESDFDEELLHPEDFKKLIDYSLADPAELLQNFYAILERKKTKGWEQVDEVDKKFYNYLNWLSMRRKGHIMINSYSAKILSRIKEVLFVQKKVVVGEEDQLVQYIDMGLVWEDGRRVLADNKTSTIDYEADSAGRSPQLLSYHHTTYEEYKWDALGFIVLKKQIKKNKIRTCKSCGHVAETQARSCDMEVAGKRCKGEWAIQIDPECVIYSIINKVNTIAEELVMTTFDESNIGIKNKVFNKNLGSCITGYGKCEYYGLCYHNDDSEVVDLGSPPKREDIF